MTPNKAKLLPTLGLSAVIIYGVGDILGAGIYAVVGEVAGFAGAYTWLSFVIAMGIVLLSALSYGELCSRFPKSGGVSIFVQAAFSNEWLSSFVGLLLFGATVLSMSTLSQAFVGYLSGFGFYVPTWLGILSFLSILLLINTRGIWQSSVANILCTIIEISGLLIVLFLGAQYLINPHPQVLQKETTFNLLHILQGAGLAFFAFTGFEDLANIAEEVKEPRKNLARAILYALGSAGILYISVSWVATAVVSGVVLSESKSPLLEVVIKAAPSFPTQLFSFIAIFAVANTTLLNYITSSRLLYGMAEINLLPAFFQKIHPQYKTPFAAILTIFPIVFILGVTGTLQGLASSTSAIILTVFTFSCIALAHIKLKERRQKKERTTDFEIPTVIPLLAILLNTSALFFLSWQSIVRAGLFILASLIFIVCFRIRAK